MWSGTQSSRLWSLGDFNIEAPVMHAWLTAQPARGDIKILSPGKTCFAGSSEGTALDYAVMDHSLVPWFWHMAHLSLEDTGLATHAPVRWSLKWAGKQQVEVHVRPGRTGLDSAIGP